MTDRRTRRAFLTTGLLTASAGAGCLVLGNDGETPTRTPGETNEDHAPPPSQTEPASGSLTECEEPRSPSFPRVDRYDEWDPDPPGELTTRDAAAYVENFELAYGKRDIAARNPGANEISVYIDGSPSVEAVAGGFLVHAQIAGYYDVGGEESATDDDTETVLHADLWYAVSYYLTPTAVVRSEGSEAVDPRDPDVVSQVVLCEPVNSETES